MAWLVPRCKSNYKSQAELTTAFNMLKDQDIRERWFKAIPRPRADYDKCKQLKVSSNTFIYHNC